MPPVARHDRDEAQVGDSLGSTSWEVREEERVVLRAG